MKVTLFESTGLDRVAKVIEAMPNISNKETVRKLLKNCNLFFSIEGINRVQSMLICELQDSYVQQSQRYVTCNDYVLPSLKDKDKAKGEELITELFALYEKMTERKAGASGRPKKEDFIHGIPLEDARYILPLAVTTNMTVCMSGDKLIDLFGLLQNNDIFKDLQRELEQFLPEPLKQALYSWEYPDAEDETYLRTYYETFFFLMPQRDSVNLLEHFALPEMNVALGALTSTNQRAASQLKENLTSEKAQEVIKRVLSYGHESILEQARFTFGLNMSLSAYHQFVRHRMFKNVRESLEGVLKDKSRDIVIPPSIRNSQFKNEYLNLVKKAQAFQSEIFSEYGEDKALPFLLNCQKIKIITSANARALTEMLTKRTCLNAQWEIRNLAKEMFKALYNLSPVLFQEAVPNCLKDRCKEGKFSCGRPDEAEKYLFEL